MSPVTMLHSMALGCPYFRREKEWERERRRKGMKEEGRKEERGEEERERGRGERKRRREERREKRREGGRRVHEEPASTVLVEKPVRSTQPLGELELSKNIEVPREKGGEGERGEGGRESERKSSAILLMKRWRDLGDPCTFALPREGGLAT